jgi:hypothetical protein
MRILAPACYSHIDLDHDHNYMKLLIIMLIDYVKINIDRAGQDRRAHGLDPSIPGLDGLLQIRRVGAASNRHIIRSTAIDAGCDNRM